MIRYELKDKEHQAALEKALPGFNEELQARCAWAFEDEENYVGVSHCDGVQHPGFYWEVDVPKEQIEVIGKYDPKKWNKYPEVTPPEDISLRCEGHDRDTRQPFRAILRYLDGGFCFDSTDPRRYRGLFPGMVIDRFRPWDEEGEE